MTKNLRLKIYGERNTGTNYLQQLCQQNLEVILLPSFSPGWIRRIQSYLPGREWLIDLYFSLTFSSNLGWKHRKLDLDEFNEYYVQTSIITVTKNPYSWLLSLYARPYHQYYSEKPTFEEFLVSPWKTVNRENSPKILPNPIILWNQKNGSYLDSENRFNVLNLRYEDILENPANIVNKIKTTFNLKTRDRFQNIESSTKDKEKDFNYYKKYYLNKEWRKQLSKNNIDIINKFLDLDLLNYYSYEKEE